jgi:hypothetical protein
MPRSKIENPADLTNSRANFENPADLTNSHANFENRVAIVPEPKVFEKRNRQTQRQLDVEYKSLVRQEETKRQQRQQEHDEQVKPIDAYFELEREAMMNLKSEWESEKLREFLYSAPSPALVRLTFHNKYKDDVWYHGLKSLVTIEYRLNDMMTFEPRRWPERYRELIEDVHREHFTLPMADDSSIWRETMTCAARMSAQEFVNQVNAFIEKGHSVGETERYVKHVFDWLNEIGHWLFIIGLDFDFECRVTIAALLLPIAIRYGISFQSHSRFCISSSAYILSRAPYEAVRQWTIAYDMQIGLTPLYHILQRPSKERAQMILLMKGHIKQHDYIYVHHDEIKALYEIVREVPHIVLDILQRGLDNTKKTKYTDLVRRAQRYIATYQSSMKDYMIPPLVSIVMEYID